MSDTQERNDAIERELMKIRHAAGVANLIGQHQEEEEGGGAGAAAFAIEDALGGIGEALYRIFFPESATRVHGGGSLRQRGHRDRPDDHRQ